MNLLQVINTVDLADGGAARYATDLSASLTDQGETVTTFVWRGIPVGGSTMDPNFIFRAKLGTFRWLMELRRHGQTSDAALVHGHYLAASALASVALRCAQVPTFLIPHGVFTTYQQSYSRTRKMIFDRLIGRRSADWSIGTIVMSEAEKRDLPKWMPPPLLVSIGTHLFARFEESSARRPPTVEHFELLSLSRIAPKKRIDLTIAAAARLADRGVSVHLKVAGSGDERFVFDMRDLGRRAVDRHPLLRISWLGRIGGEQKRRALLAAHVMMLPSDDENFGIAIAEALAMGTPVMCSRAAAASTFVTGPPSAGFVLDDCQPLEMASQLEELLQPQFWSMCSTNAQLNAGRNLKWPEVNKVFLQKIKRCLDEVAARSI